MPIDVNARMVFYHFQGYLKYFLVSFLATHAIFPFDLYERKNSLSKAHWRTNTSSSELKKQATFFRLKKKMNMHPTM